MAASLSRAAVCAGQGHARVADRDAVLRVGEAHRRQRHADRSGGLAPVFTLVVAEQDDAALADGDDARPRRGCAQHHGLRRMLRRHGRPQPGRRDGAGRSVRRAGGPCRRGTQRQCAVPCALQQIRFHRHQRAPSPAMASGVKTLSW
jgi:hypothetical protein